MTATAAEAEHEGGLVVGDDLAQQLGTNAGEHTRPQRVLLAGNQKPRTPFENRVDLFLAGLTLPVLGVRLVMRRQALDLHSERADTERVAKENEVCPVSRLAFAVIDAENGEVVWGHSHRVESNAISAGKPSR